MTNLILEAAYLPDLPLGEWASAPGLAEAAAVKLRVLQRRSLERLEAQWRRLAAAAQEMADAAASVEAELTGPRWQRGAAVFAAVDAPRAASLLREVAAMHEREALAKRALVDAMGREAVGAPTSSSEGSAQAVGHSGSAQAGGRSGGGRGGGVQEDSGELRDRLTVAVASWLARPFIDDERTDLILGTLTEDMTGF